MEYNKLRKKLTFERRYEMGKKGLDDKRKNEEELKQDKSHYSKKKEKFIDPRSQIGYILQTVSEMFTDIVCEASDHKDFKCSSKLVRSYKKKRKRDHLLVNRQVNNNAYQVQEEKLKCSS